MKQFAVICVQVYSVFDCPVSRLNDDTVLIRTACYPRFGIVQMISRGKSNVHN